MEKRASELSSECLINNWRTLNIIYRYLSHFSFLNSTFDFLKQHHRVLLKARTFKQLEHSLFLYPLHDIGDVTGKTADEIQHPFKFEFWISNK